MTLNPQILRTELPKSSKTKSPRLNVAREVISLKPPITMRENKGRYVISSFKIEEKHFSASFPMARASIDHPIGVWKIAIRNHRFTDSLIRSFILEEQLPARRGTYRRRQPHILCQLQDVDALSKTVCLRQPFAFNRNSDSRSRVPRLHHRKNRDPWTHRRSIAIRLPRDRHANF